MGDKTRPGDDTRSGRETRSGGKTRPDDETQSGNETRSRDETQIGDESERWAKIDAAFKAALEQAPETRIEWVKVHFTEQTDLRDAVLELLADEFPSRKLFESAIEERDRVAEEMGLGTRQPGAQTGTLIGPYRLEYLIATGGMGAVYRAERADDQFQQTVAIKILPSWATDARTIARLKAERQILAGLQHPNITHLLDGGETADGFPYIVTEFIDGQEITAYSRENLANIKQRLEIFAKVADAVHYAHQKLIIHRDIKPSNILVDSAGQPHLLDFGIAKILEAGACDGGSPQTVTGFTPMTPQYASPEQRAGKDVSTASDVYQLGLLLFHLLTGFHGKADTSLKSGQATRPSTAVRSSDTANELPSQPDKSKLARQLKGDLDTIVLKALRDNPEDRYLSAAEMAADIRRHLKGEAIEARPESLWSATRRLSRHYPIAATLVVSLLVVLMIWAISLFFYAQELEKQRDEATMQANRATQVKNVLVDIFRRSDPLQADTIGGKSASVWDSLDAATAEVRQQLIDQPEIQAELYSTLSKLYGYAGQIEQSVELQKQTWETYQSLGPGFEAQTAESQAVYAGSLGRDNFDAATVLMTEALNGVEGIEKTNPVAAINILTHAGGLQSMVGQFDAALAYYQRAHKMFDQSNIEDWSLQIEILSSEADVLISMDRLAEAEDLLLETMELGELHLGANQRRLTTTLSTLAALERRRGGLAKTIEYSSLVVELMEKDTATTYGQLLSAKNNLALAYGINEQFREEQNIQREVIDLRRKISGPDGNVNLGIEIKNLASSLHLSGDYDEALLMLTEAAGLIDAHFPPDSPFQALPHFTTALIYLDTDRPVLAQNEALATLAILEPALGPDHFQVQVTRCVLAEALRGQGRIEESRALAEPAMQGILASDTKTQQYVTRCQNTLTALDQNRISN